MPFKHADDQWQALSHYTSRTQTLLLTTSTVVSPLDQYLQYLSLLPAQQFTFTYNYLCLHMLSPFWIHLSVLLSTYLLTPSNDLAVPLWHNVHHIPTPISPNKWYSAQSRSTLLVMWQYNQQGRDATYAWIIWTSQDLWNGKGYISGPPSDMYTGFAKVCRVYTASFSCCTTANILFNTLTAGQINVYCNNSSVIDWINCKSNYHMMLCPTITPSMQKCNMS